MRLCHLFNQLNDSPGDERRSSQIFRGAQSIASFALINHALASAISTVQNHIFNPHRLAAIFVYGAVHQAACCEIFEDIFGEAARKECAIHTSNIRTRSISCIETNAPHILVYDPDKDYHEAPAFLAVLKLATHMVKQQTISYKKGRQHHQQYQHQQQQCSSLATQPTAAYTRNSVLPVDQIHKNLTTKQNYVFRTIVNSHLQQRSGGRASATC